MKTSSKLFVSAMAFATAVFFEANAELSGTDEKMSPASNGLATVTLRVSRGRATGNGAPGNQVAVAADAAPAGEQFAGWTGDVAVLADRFSSTTTAMVPFTAATVAAPVTASSPCGSMSGEATSCRPPISRRVIHCQTSPRPRPFSAPVAQITEARQPSPTCRFRSFTTVTSMTHTTHSSWGLARRFTFRFSTLMTRAHHRELPRRERPKGGRKVPVQP